MDDGDLTPTQSQKVQQFLDITGIQELSIAKDILIRHNWDVEVAFQEEMNLREGRPSVYATTETRTPAVVNDRFLQQVFSAPALPVARPAPGFGGLFGYIVNLVFNFCYNTVSGLLEFLLDLFRSPQRIVTDPAGDVRRFIASHAERFPEHPVFYQGTYSQALHDAKRELKFLAVFLHSDQRPESIAFCRDTLSDAAVRDYIARYMLLWGCDIASPEGYRVSHSLNARTPPIVALICLRNNKMMVVGRLEGNCSAEELLRRMRAVVQMNEIYLVQARSDRLERSLTQTIRQQQDEAYQQSLLADQEKERRRQEAREQQQRLERMLEEERLAEQRRREEIERRKLELLAAVPSEPTNDSDAIRLVFKLPNGARLERKFLASHSLEVIYNYIFCHPDAPDSFELTTNFPKRVLVSESIVERGEGKRTISETGLKNREVLFVNDLDA